MPGEEPGSGRVGAPLTHPRTRAVTRGSLTGRCPGLHAAETQLLEAQAGPLPRLCPALSPRGQLPGTGPLGWICTSCEGQAPRPAQGCGLRAGMLQGCCSPGGAVGALAETRSRAAVVPTHPQGARRGPAPACAGRHPAFPSPQPL